MYPRLELNLDKLEQNLTACTKLVQKHPNCSIMVVTKGVCADPKVVELVLNHPAVTYMADSRIENLATYDVRARAAGKKTVLLRLPMQSQVDEVVAHADLSLNSELTTIQKLNQAAQRAGKVHEVLLMIDLGDLREGLYMDNEAGIFHTVAEILKLEHISLQGIGVNLTCYGAVIPKKENLSQLVDLAERLESHFGIQLPVRSGGNSSSIYLIDRGQLPKGITNLRLGECVLLGNDTAYGTQLPGTTNETLRLQAELIEIQDKPSVPTGETGVDAFGQKPSYEDRGIMRRAIIAIGRQDVDMDSMMPEDEAIRVLGGSSDHIILDLTDCEKAYQVGDILTFGLGYGGMLRTTTSRYVTRVYT